MKLRLLGENSRRSSAEEKVKKNWIGKCSELCELEFALVALIGGGRFFSYTIMEPEDGKAEAQLGICKEDIRVMEFGEISIKDKLGRTIILRNARQEDSTALIKYLRITSDETPYLIREPEEIIITEEIEKQFIQAKIDAERELMLVAFFDGKHIGNCSLMSIAPYKRYSHRCDVAIALYKEYCGCGIGKAMLQVVLDVAKSVGYEQAELEVMAENKDAVAMYEKLGFEKFGTFPDNMKYADGSYMDAYWMMRKL